LPPTRRRPQPGPRPPARRPRRRPPVRLSTRIAGGLALLVITASGVGHALVTGLTGAIDRVDAFGGIQNRPDGTKGTNFLLVGTDGRGGLPRAERRRYHLGGVPCHCTDTIMLVHLSQDRRRASVVSIPRDTYVRLPGSSRATAKSAAALSAAGRTVSATHPAKINEAYADGGPKLAVHTVEQLTGVHVDHYLEVDFVSFMKTVDALGGVPVCTSRPLKDPYTGLNLPVGTTTLNGGRALQYVRSRHIDADSDLGRMERQQRFVAQVIHRVTSGGTLTDPARLEQVVGTVLGSVRADRGLGPADLVTLARSMKGLSSGSSEFTSVPLGDLNHRVRGVGSTVRWDPDRSGPLWAAIRADQPLAPRHTRPRHKGVRVEVPPSRISVRVENATGVNGVASAAQQALHATGFLTPGLPATADRRSARTVVRYDPRWDRSARTVAAALPGALLVPAAGQGPVMRVTLGQDRATVRPVAADTPAPGDQPRTGDDVAC